jgi:hypothetical protein
MLHTVHGCPTSELLLGQVSVPASVGGGRVGDFKLHTLRNVERLASLDRQFEQREFGGQLSAAFLGKGEKWPGDLRSIRGIHLMRARAQRYCRDGG